jgi:hypothetical protein
MTWNLKSRKSKAAPSLALESNVTWEDSRLCVYADNKVTMAAFYVYSCSMGYLICCLLELAAMLLKYFWMESSLEIPNQQLYETAWILL